MSKKIDINAARTIVGSGYPAPYDEACRTRTRRRIADVAGLTQFGVNLTTLPPGCWSSQRHWHTAEDEFVFVLEGEVVLVTDAGEEILTAGSCAGFKAGAADGHQLLNRSQRDAVVLEIGTRRPEEDQVFYPDIGLRLRQSQGVFVRNDGEPYEGKP